MKIAGINGFGRFALHFLKYWFERADKSRFQILYINDDTLTIKDISSIILSDPYVNFSKNMVSIDGDYLLLKQENERLHKILVTNATSERIIWLGEPDVFLECSGKHTEAKICSKFLVGSTKIVIISATSYNAERTLIYGFNHEDFKTSDKVISYGSCTVNAYVPLAAFLDDKYKIIESDVNVIHNQPQYKLEDLANRTLIRKSCTLQKSGPNLLIFLNSQNFNVNYTLIPYSGVSIIDLRFKLKNVPSRVRFIDRLSQEIKNGVLKGLYDIDIVDRGPDHYLNSTFSAVIIEDKIKILGDNLYLFGYFDNENSVNRYYDLTQFLMNKI
jgi:glyceraldehyde 3-phosphate dehydrogenase